MTDQVTISIGSHVFARLQRLAVPLVDDTSSVVEKLIDHWESSVLSRSTIPESGPPTKTESRQPSVQAAPEVWRSSRGDELPVGAPLQAEYLGKTFRATVEKFGIRFAGKLYENLSPAGAAAKGQLGRKGRAASTNGRDFWKIQDPVSRRWVPITALRPSSHVDTEALLAELKKL